MREKILTESEERKVDLVYLNHMELYNKVREKYVKNFDKLDLLTVIMRALLISLLYVPLLPLVLGICGAIFALLLTIGVLIVFYNNYRKSLERTAMELGLNIEDFKKAKLDVKFELIHPGWDAVYKYIWRLKKDITKLYFKYLPMKLVINENDFKAFLHIPYIEFQLRTSDVDDLIKIFNRVKERVGEMSSSECKSELTPWEFFSKYFLSEWIKAYKEKIVEESKKDPSYEKIDNCRKKMDVCEKILTYFNEFEKSSRISGDLVVELEDLLEEKEDVLSVSKDEVMKLVEAWRRYKMEERFSDTINNASSLDRGKNILREVFDTSNMEYVYNKTANLLIIFATGTLCITYSILVFITYYSFLLGMLAYILIILGFRNYKEKISNGHLIITFRDYVGFIFGGLVLIPIISFFVGAMCIILGLAFLINEKAEIEKFTQLILRDAREELYDVENKFVRYFLLLHEQPRVSDTEIVNLETEIKELKKGITTGMIIIKLTERGEKKILHAFEMLRKSVRKKIEVGIPHEY